MIRLIQRIPYRTNKNLAFTTGDEDVRL